MTEATMRPPAKSPCGTCPYRTDAPPAVWHPDEYQKLPAYDADTPHQPTGVFLCHQINGHICAGWAACHDMTHSLAIRIATMTGNLAPDDADALIDYTTDVPVFPTGRAAADHGLSHTRPSPAANRAMDKISARRSRTTMPEGTAT
jgi:hypothetical protein